MHQLVAGILLVCLVSTAVVSGVFFAFSSFVMTALRQVAHANGIRAMQAINRTAVRPAFMLLLFGTGGLVGLVTIARFGHPWVLVGSASYLVGVLGVTVAVHVPRNRALTRIDLDARDMGAMWWRYLSGWTRWNHVRVVASVVSSAAFLSEALA